MDERFSITYKTKATLPSLPFESMKDHVLGKNYTLSVVCIDDALSEELNKKYRGKNGPTDILSFSLHENEGEIFLNLARVKEEAPKHGRAFSNFVGFLFIHGLFHLKGFDHGSTMEEKERGVRDKFGIDTKNTT